MIAIEMARLGRDGVPDATATGLAPWQMRKVRERISASLELGYPKIQELADLCGISRGHLMRMFKAATGQSLHEMVTSHRLAAARRFLAEDGMSIKEISGLLRFSSAGHFTRAFQREEQMSPSEFRQRART